VAWVLKERVVDQNTWWKLSKEKKGEGIELGISKHHTNAPPTAEEVLAAQKLKEEKEKALAAKATLKWTPPQLMRYLAVLASPEGMLLQQFVDSQKARQEKDAGREQMKIGDDLIKLYQDPAFTVN